MCIEFHVWVCVCVCSALQSILFTLMNALMISFSPCVFFSSECECDEIIITIILAPLKMVRMRASTALFAGCPNACLSLWCLSERVSGTRLLYILYNFNSCASVCHCLLLLLLAAAAAAAAVATAFCCSGCSFLLAGWLVG